MGVKMTANFDQTGGETMGDFLNAIEHERVGSWELGVDS
jgi:hypothetical protein